MIRPDASQKRLLILGRAGTLVFMVFGCLLAPMLDDPKFGGVFQYIQQFQGYIWPGVVAAFLFGMVVPKAPPAAGVAALVSGPAIYALFQQFASGGDNAFYGLNIHFLIQVALTFVLVLAIMAVLTILKPLETPRILPVREDIEVKTALEVKIFGALVIIAVLAFIIIFR
jgi:SSS family solute:Na+ symporter